jgi:hypothetical protein
VATQAIVLRHREWRRTIDFGPHHADVAVTASPLLVATHVHLLRHSLWRRKKGLFFLNSFGEGLFFKIVSSLG